MYLYTISQLVYADELNGIDPIALIKDKYGKNYDWKNYHDWIKILTG